jgi:hypothetical protein
MARALRLALIAFITTVPAYPVKLAVDGRKGKDVPGCGLQGSNNTGDFAPAILPCRTIHQGAKEGDAKARATNQSLVLEVMPGLFLGECSASGIKLTVPTQIRNSARESGTVTIDCEGKGRAFSFFPATSYSKINSLLVLVGLTIQNTVSETSGGAVYVECCALIVRGSHFEHTRSLVKFGTSPYQGGGAIFVAKLLRLVITDSLFVNCSAPNANGGGIWVQQAAGTYRIAQGQEKQNIIVARCRFYDNSAYAFGGSMGVTITSKATGNGESEGQGEGASRSTSMLYDRCEFTRNTVKNKDTTIAASGAGLYILVDDEVSNTINTFSQCNFTNSAVYSDGSKVVGADGNNNAEGKRLMRPPNSPPALLPPKSLRLFFIGGGFYLMYRGSMRNVTTIITHSRFTNNRLQASGSGCFAYGAGFMILFQGATARSVMVDVSATEFRQNRANANGHNNGIDLKDGDGGGAAISIYYGAVATGVSSVFSDCHFENNAAIGYSNGYGGAINHFSSHPGVAVVFQRCSFVENTASTKGGALRIGQIIANTPANLELACRGPFSAKHFSTPFQCTPKYDSASARQWEYGHAMLWIEATSFIDNRAEAEQSIQSLVTKDAARAFGGALWISNLNTTIRGCLIERNHAQASGGAIYLDAGSAMLSLEGNTRVCNNTASESGTAVYSASGGGILLRDRASMESAKDQSASAVAILSGGELICTSQCTRTRSTEIVSILSDGNRFRFHLLN